MFELSKRLRCAMLAGLRKIFTNTIGPGVLVVAACFCTSCVKYDTIDLPALNTKTFSYEDVMNKKNALDARRKIIHERPMPH